MEERDVDLLFKTIKVLLFDDIDKKSYNEQRKYVKKSFKKILRELYRRKKKKMDKFTVKPVIIDDEETRKIWESI